MPDNSLETFIKEKKQLKRKFSEKLSLSTKKALVAIVLDKELSKQDEQILLHILDGASRIDVEVVVLADTNLRAIEAKNAKILPYNRHNREKILTAADMAIGFDFSDVEEMLLHGTIPISQVRPEVEDYNPNRETGNSFIYKKSDHWCLFAALVRALETFKFPYDWKNIVRQGIQSVKG